MTVPSPRDGMASTARAEQLAERLAAILQRHSRRIVFAESCTAGLVAALLGGIPGISDWLCGSAVTYRNDTKQRWLGVRPEDIETQTAVSAVVARQMAAGALRMTPEADVAASVTGHLGPQAPAELDGRFFVGWADRFLKNERGEMEPRAWEFRLQATSRIERQREAASKVLFIAAEQLS